MAEYMADITEREALLSCSVNGDESKHKYVPRRQIPVDRCFAVYFIFLFLGIASLLPWNFFITAKTYFQYKLRNTTAADVSYNNPASMTELQLLLLSYLEIASTVSNFICLCFTAMFVRFISLKKRVVLSLSVIIVLFAATTVLVDVNSDEWQTAFFGVTIASAAAINGATAVMTGSVFGLVCRFPPMYTQSVMTGQAVGGTFAALASIFSLLGSGTVSQSAFGYFMTATAVCAIAMVAYALLYYLDFSKYYITETDDNHLNAHHNEGTMSTEHLGHIEFYTTIIKKIWRQGIGVCVVFTVTLSVFPAVCSTIRSANYQQGDPWSDKYFIPVICYLFFNLGDWIGRPISGWIQKPSYRHQNVLLMLCVFRVILVPLLMFCDARPRSLPVWFHNDAFPIALIIILGLTNGYFGTLNMMYAPQRVPLGQAEGAGVLMSLMLTLGLALGSGLSVLLIKLL
ncbi:LOW QUALITY PROTEIN: equilibrative nucleoside transporter 3-like [Haliotis rubra]|uniref:LOW QUALITY PROTEIN: equilibrative nucleoside transporter 3-like n=1 Tax=Haliotis rubra TaxID=36100 RepID=UPI001EE5890D|nr:LOW QUALITY PROTEIN: equilibrative nucleoside transporter 3-like [Haliotis rubra]